MIAASTIVALGVAMIAATFARLGGAWAELISRHKDPYPPLESLAREIEGFLNGVCSNPLWLGHFIALAFACGIVLVQAVVLVGNFGRIEEDHRVTGER